MTVCTKFMQNFISFDKKLEDIVDDDGDDGKDDKDTESKKNK